MHPKACFALFALGLVLAQAIPAPNFEKKSVSDEARFDKNLKIDEVSDDKERAKKSTICMEIKDKGAQQLGPVQTLNLVPQQPQITSQMVPQMVPQMMPQMQAYSIPSPQQPVQTLSVIQTQAHPPQPQTVVMPQPQTVVMPQPVQPIHTLQIIQPPQPCAQQPSVNIVQPPITQVKEVVQNVEPEPTQPPAPQTTTQPPMRIVKPVYKPEKMVVPQYEQVDVGVVPMTTVCKEHMVMVPSRPLMMMPEPQKVATLVKVPHCHHHSHQAIVTQCNCKPQAVSMEPMNVMALQRSRMMAGHALVPRNAASQQENEDAKEQKEN